MSETFVDWNDVEPSVPLDGVRMWEKTAEHVKIGRIEMPAGVSWPAHQHEHEQLCVVLQGQLEFTAEGAGTRVLGPGGVFHFSSGQTHGGRTVGDGKVVFLEVFSPVPPADHRKGHTDAMQAAS